MSERNHATKQGDASHELIAQVAIAHGGNPSRAEILAVARAHRVGGKPSGGRALRAARLTRATRFFSRFGRPGWELLGAEVSVGDIRFDLVWTKDGRVEADEIKSGRLGAWTSHESVEVQLFEQFLAGRHKWGNSFVGVRLVPLLQPEMSYVYKGEEPS